MLAVSLVVIVSKVTSISCFVWFVVKVVLAACLRHLM